MDNMTGLKTVLVSPTITLNTGGTASITSAVVDTLGYRRLKIVVLTGTVASGGSLSVLKAQSSTASGGSYADVVDAGATTIVEGSDDARYDLDVDLRGQDRYFKAVVTTAAAANTPVTVIAILGDPDESPATDSALVGSARG